MRQRDSWVGRDFEVLIDPRTGRTWKDWPDPFTITDESNSCYELTTDSQIYTMAKVAVRQALADSKIMEAPDGCGRSKGNAGIRVDEPGPSAGDSQPGGEGGAQAGSGARVDVGGSGGSGTERRTGLERRIGQTQETSFGLAKAIVDAVLDAAFVDVPESRRTRLPQAVLDTLTEHRAWFIRIRHNDDMNTVHLPMKGDR